MDPFWFHLEKIENCHLPRFFEILSDKKLYYDELINKRDIKASNRSFFFSSKKSQRFLHRFFQKVSLALLQELLKKKQSKDHLDTGPRVSSEIHSEISPGIPKEIVKEIPRRIAEKKYASFPFCISENISEVIRPGILPEFFQKIFFGIGISTNIFFLISL